MEKEDTDKILKLKEEIDKVSDELTKKVRAINADVITTRENPEVKEIWNRLCRLHMKAVVSCEYDPSKDEQYGQALPGDPTTQGMCGSSPPVRRRNLLRKIPEEVERTKTIGHASDFQKMTISRAADQMHIC